jgi:hypothetical protein
MSVESNQSPMEVPEGMTLVSIEDLKKWLDTIKAFNQFKADAETDIGYLAEAAYNLQHIDNPMKLVTKLLMGNVDVKSIGLDLDRMHSIAEKYAPATTARLKAKEEESKTKK